MATTPSSRQQPASGSAPAFAGGETIATIIGPGIRVNGRVAGEEDLSVEGHVEGAINLTETLFVAVDGVVVAEVRARDVVVSGIVIGNVTAEDSVTLNAGAKLIGDIEAPRVIIADGAAFSGNVTMTGQTPARPRERRAAKPVATPQQTRPAAAARPPAPVRGRAPIAAPSRVPAIPRPQVRDAFRGTDDETIVVRHSEVQPDDGNDPLDTVARKKGPPRARVPKPGKRRVNRA